MAADLHSLIAGVLHPMTHSELNETPLRIAGLVVPNGEGLSKRQRIDLALENLTQEDLARLALKLAAHRGDIALDEAARKVLEAGDPPLSHITRRNVARVFGDDLAGERNTVEIVERLFVLSTPFDGVFGSGGRSLRDQIGQHMDRNPGDWTVEALFGEIDAFNCSRARFAALLEDAVHPLSRCGEQQLQTVAELNKVLARDGYELAQEGELSGHPIFAFRSLTRGVGGRPKNLIFASRGPKPEIGFADAINNDIVILSGEESCVLQKPIGLGIACLENRPADHVGKRRREHAACFAIRRDFVGQSIAPKQHIYVGDEALKAGRAVPAQVMVPEERMICTFDRLADCPRAELEEIKDNRRLWHFRSGERPLDPWDFGGQDTAERLLIATARSIAVWALFRKAKAKGSIADTSLDQGVEPCPQPLIDRINRRGP
jgi:hypothetical protein